MRRLVASAVLVVAGAAIVLGLAGCGGDDDTLTVYSGRSESLVAPLIERFSDETGIDVDVRYGDTNDLALLIGTEGDGSPADVYWGQSPGATAYLAGRDLLAPLPAETLGLVAPGFEDRDGEWVGISGRERTLVYNQDLVEESELPDSVLELTDERYRGRVAIAPNNGSFQDFVTALRNIEGEQAAEDWLAGMAANDVATYANNNAIVEAVGRGEVEMGLVNHYYNYRFLAEDPGLPSRNHQFEDGDIGNLVIPSSASVLAASERQEDARAFVAYLLSQDAQRYFADETFEYPLAQGVAPAEGVPPLDSLRPPTGERADELGDIEETGRMIAAAGLN